MNKLSCKSASQFYQVVLWLFTLHLILSQSTWLVECDSLRLNADEIRYRSNVAFNKPEAGEQVIRSSLGVDQQVIDFGPVPELEGTNPENIAKLLELKAEVELLDIADSEPLPVAKGSLAEKLTHLVKGAIAPAQNYVQLVNRYRAWFRNYNALKKTSKRQLKEAGELLKIEYAKANELLSADACSSEDLQKLESTDFVYRALDKVIDQLERILEESIEREGIELSDGLDGVELISSPVDEEQVRVAMDRIERTAVRTARNWVQGELKVVARIAFWNTLAGFMAAREVAPGGDALSFIEPIVFLFGSASTPLIVGYLQSIQFRTALAIINKMNPMQLLCKRVQEPSNKLKGE